MKIGLIRETKTPTDNRVAITPQQAAQLQSIYGCKVIVQSSQVRAYTDDEYKAVGVTVAESVADCDILLGVKEVNVNALIPNKHYCFFSHIAKLQPYNRALLGAIINKGITLTDYEYLTDETGRRTVAFGFYAGAVGAYNTIRLYGIKYGVFDLSAPLSNWSISDLSALARKVTHILGERKVKILVTGKGRVSDGCQYVLNGAGIPYTLLGTDMLVTNNGLYDRDQFHRHPTDYVSRFSEYSATADVLISCHYWSNNAPKYLTKAVMRGYANRIKVVGDVTCDINGSIECTIRPTTHAKPFFDYSPEQDCEVPFLSDPDNISVMAVDTLPNALPREASAAFGEMVIKNIITPMLKGEHKAIDAATLVELGRVTEPFSYLNEFAHEEKENQGCCRNL